MPLFSHCLLIEQGKILAGGKKKDVLTAETIYEAFHVPVNLHWVQDRPWIQVR
jgi:iron complex transport system ATP-binding protein